MRLDRVEYQARAPGREKGPSAASPFAVRPVKCAREHACANPAKRAVAGRGRPPLPGTLSDKQKWNREILSPSAAPDVWGGRGRF